MNMDRKKFIQSFGKLVTGMMIGGWTFQSCGAIHYATVTEEKDRFIVKKKEFLRIRKDRSTERNFVLIQTKANSAPIGIFKLDVNEYSAALLECTHRGCELTPGGNTYTCPCHGSEFSMEGEVLQGPAEKHLKTFDITTDNENIYIHL